MKRSRFLSLAATTVVAIFASAFITPVQAQQSANSAANASYGSQTVDPNNGGFNAGTGYVTGDASDPMSASVDGVIKGNGVTNDHVGATNSIVNSNANTGAKLFTKGNSSNAAIGTGVNVGSWAQTMSSPDTGAAGGSVLSGASQDAIQACDPVTGDSDANASSKTKTASSGGDTNNANASGLTIGHVSVDSTFTTHDAGATQDGVSSISGMAGMSTGATALGPDNSFADGSTNSGASMNGGGNSPGASGFVASGGSVHATVTPSGNGAAVVAKTSSAAIVH